MSDLTLLVLLVLILPRSRLLLPHRQRINSACPSARIRHR
jgi:hypothetical protein